MVCIRVHTGAGLTRSAWRNAVTNPPNTCLRPAAPPRSVSSRALARAAVGLAADGGARPADGAQRADDVWNCATAGCSWWLDAHDFMEAESRGHCLRQARVLGTVATSMRVRAVVAAHTRARARRQGRSYMVLSCCARRAPRRRRSLHRAWRACSGRCNPCGRSPRVRPLRARMFRQRAVRSGRSVRRFINTYQLM